MRRRAVRLHCLIIPVALALTACVATRAAAQSDDAEAIRRVLVAMWDAIEVGDLDRYPTHVPPDFTSFG